MARELVLRSWCDGDHDEDVAAVVARTITVDRGEPIVLDLCEVCDKTVRDLLHLMGHGVPAKQAIVAPGERPFRGRGERINPRKPSEIPGGEPTRADGRDRRDCPECDYIGATRSAMGQHLKVKHGKKFTDYDWTPDK